MKDVYRRKLFSIIFGDDSSSDFSELWTLLDEMIEHSLMKRKYTEEELRDFQKACDRFGVKFNSTVGKGRQTCYIHMAVSGELRGNIRRCNYEPLYLHAGHGMEKCNGVNHGIWMGKSQKSGHAGSTPGRSSAIDAFKPVILHDCLNICSDLGRNPREFRSSLALHGKSMRLQHNRTKTSHRRGNTAPVNPLPRQTKASKFLEVVSPEQMEKDWTAKKIRNLYTRECNHANRGRQNLARQPTPNQTITPLVSSALQLTTHHAVTPTTPPTTSNAVLVWPSEAYPCIQRPERRVAALPTDESFLSPQQVRQEHSLLNAMHILDSDDDDSPVSSALPPTVQSVTPATLPMPSEVNELPRRIVSLSTAQWTQLLSTPDDMRQHVNMFPDNMSYVEMVKLFSTLPIPSAATIAASSYSIVIDQNGTRPSRVQKLEKIDLGARYDVHSNPIHKAFSEVNRCFYLHLALPNNIHPVQLCAAVRGIAVSKLKDHPECATNNILEVLQSAIRINDLVDFYILQYAWPRTLLKCAVHLITEDSRQTTMTLRELISIYPPIDICPDMEDEGLQHVILCFTNNHYTLMQVCDDSNNVLTDQAALKFLVVGVVNRHIVRAE